MFKTLIPTRGISAVLAVLVFLAGIACIGPASPSPIADPGAQPKQGGEFRVNMEGEPDTIDPNISNFTKSTLVASLAFEGLLKYDKELNLEAGAAREIPSLANGGISSDGLTYTFRLRPDGRWSDGQPVKAKDFVYAIRRSLDPKLAANYASTLYDIQGAKEYNAAKDASADQLATLRQNVALSAPDDSTVVIKLKAPRPSFLHLASLWVAWPVRQDVIETHGDRWTEPPNYIGNGPFILTRWAHGERLEFAPNPHYAGQKPHLDKLVLLQIADTNQAFLAFRNGELDLTAVPDANAKVVQADPQLASQVLRYSELHVAGFQFNVNAAPFDNAKVRQALAMAVDREALVDKVAQGVGRVAYSVNPPGMPGHDPNVGRGYAFDVEKAKRLLAEADYPDASKFPKFTFSFSDSAANKVRAEFFQGQMKQNLGIDVVLESLDSKTYQQRFNNEQFQMVYGGWSADYPDPDNFIPEIFKGGSGNNHTGYKSAQADAYAGSCQAELDLARRIAACMDAQKVVVSDQPWIFLFNRERFWLVREGVQGFQVTAKNQLPGSAFYNHLWLDK